MCRNVSKYALIFLFLALSGFIFLLRNIHTVENWNCHTIFSPLPAPEQDPKPTPEDELEERYLLDSITWPGPPPRSSPPALRQTSDPVHSLFAVLPTPGGREWHVGDQLEALVQMHDFQGRPKRYGGGFHFGQTALPRAGSRRSGEAVAVLRRLREERPDRVFFKSLFRLGFLSETTVCNMCLPLEQPLCNYTDLYTGEPWYCYKPKMLSCDSRINHAKAGYQKHLITNKEALLFQSGVNIKVPIHASGPDGIDVLPPRKEVEVESSSVKPEPIKLAPSGYYYEDSWRPLSGITMRQFNESSAVTQCLKNKVINMYGDSTVRQWFEYLITLVPGLREFNLNSPMNVGPFMAVDSTHNILLKYRCHGPPIRFSTVMASELRYVSNELDGLSGGPNTVVVLSIWAHFSTFFPWRCTYGGCVTSGGRW
ncbi:hypothetical protein KUCAC02_010021 [Chaenocephalus aceratus]|uniref:Uncharacterized protein n=1 Tax=Chaenocephalus aceratus TaxID=36190 RepID=A0ACB9VZP5_CHAAC|nr:hypothetical protein KUCAC02_010021 [Chaenocephalus aceratus]